LLRRHRTPATFFVVGRLAEQYPDLVRRMADEGHLVGNHSFLHAQAPLLSAGEALCETARTQALLRRILGKAPALYRPPRGQLSVGKLLRLWHAGLGVVLWNVDPRDYACRSADELRDWFGRRPLRGGDLVLLHDRVPHALEVLPGLIEDAHGRGLTFAPVTAWVK
jgi:peptidoglycan/xylan/chitin deacetylase (PgdA/CDA1 family)